MEVIKSANDDRQYRFIELENGVRALLVSYPCPEGYDHIRSNLESEGESDEDDGSSSSSSSDSESDDERMDRYEDSNLDRKPPGEKKSSASLCIGVGSFCDPSDIPGFAHFLEHMVFMGSEKYPKENEFDDYLGKHGGETNASTDCEKTTFYFEIQRKYFRKALDRFAHFFISPLLKKDSVDREIQAVDSEFQMTTLDDGDRVNQLLASTAKPGHPMSKFTCGNLKTLKTDPERTGLDVYARLRSFYERMYSSHYMTLVLQSFENLDTLERWVKEIFSAVPCSHLPQPSFRELKGPFDTAEFRKFYKVVPVEDINKLEISWALPSLLEHYRVKPLDYVSTLIQHEGKGSILSYLKKRLWALSISGGNGCDGFEHNSTYASFFVSITLTDSGLQHVYEVLTALFEYICLLQRLGPQLRVFQEQQWIEEAKFKWKEQGDPMDYVETVSESMQLYPTEHILTGKYLLYDYDEQLIRQCTDYLQPDQANITLMSKTPEFMKQCNQEEEWYGTKYSVQDVNPEWLQRWKNLDSNPEFFIPEPNVFIATDFSLRICENPLKIPYPVIDNEHCRFWYKKDNKFNVPKGLTYIHFMSLLVSESVKNATLNDIFINILLHNLTESIYPAVLAGYEYSVEGFFTGVVVQMEGFSHKLPVLMKSIVDHIVEFSFTPELFNAMRTQLKKAYNNEMIKPYELTRMMRFAVLEPRNQSVPDRYKIISSLHSADLTQFIQKFKERLFVEGFVIGNFTAEEVREMGEYVQSKMCQKPLPLEDRPKKLLFRLPNSRLAWRVKCFDQNDCNCCMTNYYQSAPGTFLTCCLNELLVTYMREPCFDFLRTQHQLGYSVFCQSMMTNGIMGLSVTVESQATKFSLLTVDNRITEFLESFQDTLEDMTEEEFHSLVESVITSKKCEDTHLGEAAGRFWQEIQDQFYVFDRQQKEIEVLKNLTHSAVIEWYKEYLDDRQRKLSLQVEGTSQCDESCDSHMAVDAAVSNRMMDISMPTEHEQGDCNEKSLVSLQADEPGTVFITDINVVRNGLTEFPYTKITS